MTQTKMPVNGFKWRSEKFRFNEVLIQNYNEDSNKGYIIEADVKYPKKLHELYSDLPFLPESMKIEKCKKLVRKLCNTKKYVIHMKALKQAMNPELKLKTHAD